MAAMDFMHKQLVSAAGRDALTSIGAGAGIGAGVGAANALVTGNDSLLGGATSGAMLGAGGGAALRYAGAKYGSGLMAAKASEEKIGTGLQTSMFTRAVKGTDPQMSFMGGADDAKNMSSFMSQVPPSKGAAANATNAPTGASIKADPTDVKGPVGKTLKEEAELQKQQKDRKKITEAFTSKDSNVNIKHGAEQSKWEDKKKAYLDRKAAKTPSPQPTANVSPNQARNIPGLTNSGGPSASLDDVLSYMR